MRALWQAVFSRRRVAKVPFFQGFVRTGLASARRGPPAPPKAHVAPGRANAAILVAKSALSACSVSAKGRSPAADGRTRERAAARSCTVSYGANEDQDGVDRDNGPHGRKVQT